MLGGPTETAKAFDNAGGDVGGRRIDHGVVVGEGNVAEEAAVVVAIEGAPAAIAILHAEKPLDAAANGAFHAGQIGIFYALERHEDEGGVVDVGIKIVAEFERPAAGLGVFVFDLPVAGAEDLLRKHPVRGFDQRGMIGGKSGFLERDHGDAGVPDRRNAGLHSNGVAVFDFEAGEFLDFAPGQRIVRAVTERHEREDGIHHRGVNGGEAFGAFEVIEHPGFCFAEGALAKRLPREFLVEFQAAVEREENIFPGEELLAPIEGGVLVG